MQQRITQITLAPEGGQIFDEGNYTITATDEGGGEFIEVAEMQGDDTPKIRIDKSDWSSLRAAIDRMMGEIRPDYEEEEAEPAWRDPLTEKFKEQDAERLAGTEQGPQSIELTGLDLAFVRAARKAKSWEFIDGKMIMVVKEFEDIAKCLDPETLVSALPDSVLRLIAIGTRAERYAATGYSFAANNLDDINGDLARLMKCARKEVAELIAEARK